MQPRTDREDFDSLRKAANTPILDADEEHALACAAAQGDASAFDRLVRAHMRLVFSIAEHYTRFGATRSDLVSEGMLALVTAARRFDPSRGVRLAAYASYWIHALLRRHSLLTRRIVRPPSTRNGRMLLAHLRKTERKLVQAHGEAPDRSTLAQHLGVSERDVEETMLALGGRDTAIGDGGGGERSAVDLSCPEASPEAVVSRLEEQRVLELRLTRAMRKLKTRERDVVQGRRLQEPPRSFAELGADLGVSRERARQIDMCGYEKLRAALLASVA